MDNRLTKRRLSDFLSYEWILMIIMVVVAIIVWELAYTVGAVRLTVGQQFKYYYDQSISSVANGEFYNLLKDKNTFSYDVLEIESEALTADYNVLSVRLSVQEGDILITDSKEPDENATDKQVRAKMNIDNYSVYSLDKMLSDAEKYLGEFLKDDAPTDAELKYANLDEKKIEEYFLERMKKDNRFRSEEEKRAGVALEKERIEKLCAEVADFSYFLNYAKTERTELLYTYTKYLQSWELSDVGSDNEKMYKNAYENEVSEGRENVAYGINVEYLTGGNTDASVYFKMQGADTAENVVMMAFDFYEYQPHLQFETISFMNTVIRECSDILSKK